MAPNAGHSPSSADILIVEDDQTIREMLEHAVSMAGMRCSTASNGMEALQLLAVCKDSEGRDIDVVVTDINMPILDGIGLLETMKRDRHTSDVIVMTGAIEDYSYDSIIAMGASDFIRKPVGIKEFLVRLKRVLRERRLLLDLQKANVELTSANTSLRDLHIALQDSYIETIHCLVLAAEYKDEDTGDHIIRISRFSALIAEYLGLPPKEVKHILYASPMHDIGKIGIPDSIMLKAGRLTPEEFNVVKTHTTIGAAILANSKSDIIKLARQIALHHHEKWDGTGYPDGLAGDRIPLAAQIVGLVDVFDALTSSRPYKKAYPLEIAVSLIQQGRDKHFSPGLVDAFMECVGEIWNIRKEITSTEHLAATAFVWSERDRESGVDRIIEEPERPK